MDTREQVLNQIIKKLYSRKMRYIAYKYVLQNKKSLAATND